MSVSPSFLLAGGVAVAGVVWCGVWFARSSAPINERRAPILYALAVGQPILMLLLSARTAAEGGAISNPSHLVSILGRLLDLGLLAVAATLLVSPVYRVTRGARAILVGAWGMALALYAANALSPEHDSVRYEFYFAIALTGLVAGCRDSETLVVWGRRTTRVIVGISLASAVVAPHWAFIGASASGYDRTIFGIPRLTGLSPHPNALAAIALAGLLLEFGARRKSTLGALCWGSAAAVCAVLTQSNTGYVAAVVGLMTLLAVRRARYRAVVVASLVSILALYIVTPATIVPRSLRTSDYVTSVSGRTTIWRLSLAGWRSRPLLGYGPSMFDAPYQTSHFPADLQASNGHDQLVQTLADSGIVGALALTLVFAGMLWSGWRQRRSDRGLGLALTVVFWTFALTETPLRVVGAAMVPALLTLGLTALASRDIVGAETDAEASTYGVRFRPRHEGSPTGASR